MDFEKTIKFLVNDFDKANIEYALIGGFAIGALGIMRATMDVDFLIKSTDLDLLDSILKKYSYKSIYKTENVSQYVSDLLIFGEIDFLHAFRAHSIEMLKRAKYIDVFDNQIKIKVLCPEDIIGLKLQAVINDATRESKDRADIENIVEKFQDKLNWKLIEEYFVIFNQHDKFVELKAKYANHQ